MIAESAQLKAATHIEQLDPKDVSRYMQYMQTVIEPRTTEDVFKRALFSFASVHTSWVTNCRMYEELKNLQWLHSEHLLKEAIVRSGAGLHNNRTRFIHAFSEFFWDHPKWFNKSRHETWGRYRDRVESQIKGIGFAKAAFLTELLYPVDYGVVCVDTHIMQLYDCIQGKTPVKQQREIEAHWVATCLRRGVPAAVARWLYWDTKAGYASPRFWSFVFEEENYNERLAQLTQPQK